jgi:arylsulfatase A-like enzyme
MYLQLVKKITLTWACAMLSLGAIQVQAQRPNVIVIMTDDQGYGEFSCNGNPIVQTPAIDALAAESIQMTQFHASPMCTPTRGQLMSGLDAFRNNAVNVSSGRSILRPDIKTMANYFKEAGYNTGLFGKWHLGDNYPFRPMDRGFSESVWFPSSHINSVPDFWNNTYTNDVYLHKNKRQTYQGYCTDVFFDETIKYIEKSKDKPFFVYLAPNAAHSPHYVAERYKTPIKEAVAKNPDYFANVSPQEKEEIISFLAQGATVDENIAKLDAYLKKANLYQNTIIIFTTDNGSTWGDKYYNAGMRGRKTTLWEGGHRVPFFVRWPNGNFRPQKINELSHMQDVLPTLADAAKIPLEGRLDGKSLLKLWLGNEQTLGNRKLVINYSRMPGMKLSNGADATIPSPEGAAVLWGPWRLLENKYLYNIETDPEQKTEVSAQNVSITRELKAHLAEWWNGVQNQVSKIQRVVIGSRKEKTSLLTACEWVDVFVDMQKQVRRGDLRNGVWHLTAAKSGQYIFKLRRWPKESKLDLKSGAPEVPLADGPSLLPGKELPIEAASLEINGQLYTIAKKQTSQYISFQIPITKGDFTLKATFLDANNKELLGAYYVYVHKK